MRLPVNLLAERYKDRLFAAAFAACGNRQDAEDAVQEAFIQYHVTQEQYQDEQHIKAWLIRVAVNKAKDLCRSFWRRNKVSLDDYMETLEFGTPADESLFEAVMGLPQKYRIVLHLYYYEDYSTAEIAENLGLNENTVRTRLSRARGMLKKILKEEWEDDKQ